jgi:hypothetical protein
MGRPGVHAGRDRQEELQRVDQDLPLRRELARQPRDQGRIRDAARLRLLDLLGAELDGRERVERGHLLLPRLGGSDGPGPGLWRRARQLFDGGAEQGRQLLGLEHPALWRLRPGHMARQRSTHREPRAAVRPDAGRHSVDHQAVVRCLLAGDRQRIPETRLRPEPVRAVHL